LYRRLKSRRARYAHPVLKIPQSLRGTHATFVTHQFITPLEATMSQKDKKQEGELSEQQLDGVAGGQEVKKMGTIVVEAKRLPPEQKIVKMETITVTASREKPDVAGTKIASVSVAKKNN